MVGTGRFPQHRTARFASAEDKRTHVEEFHAIEGSRQLLERLEAQSK
jgi:hypothetical protein